MKQIAVIGLKLAVICAIAATTLALINGVTAPRIEAYRQQRIQEALQQVSGGYSVGDAQEADDHDRISTYHPLTDDTGALQGYVLQVQSSGYGGPMRLIVGYRSDGSVITARLLDNDETPGLGKDAERPEYMEKFEGTGGPQQGVPTRAGQLPSSEADAISGSTITFIGVAEGISRGSAFVKELGGSNE